MKHNILKSVFISLIFLAGASSAWAYTVTLGWCDFGEYGVMYNNKVYYSKLPNTNVTFQVPHGAKITIIDANPKLNAYEGKIIVEMGGSKTDHKVNDIITVTGDVKFDDNFVTKEDYTVYLGIPNSLTDWYQKDAYYIWRSNSMGNMSITQADEGKLVFEHGGIKYYKFNIAKGCHTFRFQHKQLGQYGGTTDAQSTPLSYAIPLTNINCFMLINEKDGSNRYKGVWGKMPTVTAENGDYRLLYVEQVVEEIRDGEPYTRRTKEHPSDIIKATDSRTLYSLHIFNKVDGTKDIYGNLFQGVNNPEVILQKWNGSQWQDVQRHMVFGPLDTRHDIAGMPGRRNAGAVIVDDDGIENIKNDLKNINNYNADNTKTFYIGEGNTNYAAYVENFEKDSCSGVWNFVVNRNADGSINTTKPLIMEETHRYQGEYYVRSIAASGWTNYASSKMTRHNPAQDHSNYSHYFCKDITANTEVTFTVANQYSAALNDILVGDETTLWGKVLADGEKMVTDAAAGKLPLAASVRFSWNEKTNLLHRAYIDANATGDFLTLINNKTKDEFNFADKNNTNWIYDNTIPMKPEDRIVITADYAGKRQEFIGKQEDGGGVAVFYGDDAAIKRNHRIRLLYYFQTNELIASYVPEDGKDIDPINTNLMLVRTEGIQDNVGVTLVTQLEFNENHLIKDNQYAYGVLELTRDRLLSNKLSNDELSFYWISFPFDVNLEDVFGYGTYGKHWVIESYDGASRAEKGLWKDEGMNTYWKYHWDENYTLTNLAEEDKILKAGQGYVVALDLELIQNELKAQESDPLTATASDITLYFRSKEMFKNDIVNNLTHQTSVEEHECTIHRNTPYGDRRQRDSHWNLIGVPSYANAGVAFDNASIATTINQTLFYYEWIGKTNTYKVQETNPGSMKTMHSYMVQYYGNLDWTSVVNENPIPAIAARKNTDSETVHNLRLELQQNGNPSDRTFITLQEDDVTAGFDFNYDLSKITNKGANIYSLIATDSEPIEVAGNVMPVAEDMVIPVGVIISQAGNYTFSMPDGTAGIEVQLIDYQTNEKTNLLLGDYTINLPKGTFDNRFALLINPDKVATSVDNIGADADGTKKYIIDGKLYMQQGGITYDAQGRIVR